MVAGLDGVELTSNLFVKLVRFLLLTIEHTALQCQGRFLDARHVDDLRLNCFSNLIHVSDALRAADAEDFSPVLADGYVDGKLTALVKHFSCITLLAHIGQKQRFLPDDAECTPADGH